MGCVAQYFRRIRRSCIRHLFASAGYSKDTDLVNYLEGIRAEPIMDELPLSYRLYDRKDYLATSCSLYGLGNSMKPGDDEVFIIGSGPSIKNQAIEKLAGRNTILLNGAASLVNTASLSPFAYSSWTSSFAESVWTFSRHCRQAPIWC